MRTKKQIKKGKGLKALLPDSEDRIEDFEPKPYKRNKQPMNKLLADIADDLEKIKN